MVGWETNGRRREYRTSKNACSRCDFYVYIGANNHSDKAGFTSLVVSGMGSIMNDDDGTDKCENMWDCELASGVRGLTVLWNVTKGCRPECEILPASQKMVVAHYPPLVGIVYVKNKNVIAKFRHFPME